MNKTLADLKRDLQIGDSLTLIEAPTMPNHKYLNLKRYIVRKQGNGVYLNIDKEAKTGSFIEFINAKLTAYDGKTIETYRHGVRPITEDEARIMANAPTRRPENAEKIKLEIMSDTNGSWYLDKKYYSELGCSYLFESGGTRHFNYHDKTITDQQLKGELELKYLIK